MLQWMSQVLRMVIKMSDCIKLKTDKTWAVKNNSFGCVYFVRRFVHPDERVEICVIGVSLETPVLLAGCTISTHQSNCF